MKRVACALGLVLVAACAGEPAAPDPTVTAVEPAPAGTRPLPRGSCPLPGCPETALPAGSGLTGVWVAPTGEVWASAAGGFVGRRASDEAGGDWCWCSTWPAGRLTAVWGSAADDVWFAGDDGVVQHFDGAGFTAVDVGTTATLHDVWGSGPDDVHVVGAAGTARHFDGAGWEVVDVAAEHALHGVWGSDGADVWAVGRVAAETCHDCGGEPCCFQGAEAEVFRWTAPGWRREAAFLADYGDAALFGVSGTSSGDVWAVGDLVPAGAATRYAFAAHYDGTDWSALPIPEELQQDRAYSDVAVGAPGAVAWVTAYGDEAVRWGGAAWSAAGPGTEELTVGSSRVDLQACKLEYSIVSPK